MCFLATLILFLLIQLRGPRNSIVPTSKPQIPALLYCPEGIKILHQNELTFFDSVYTVFSLLPSFTSVKAAYISINSQQDILYSTLCSLHLVSGDFTHWPSFSIYLFLLWLFQFWCSSEFYSFLGYMLSVWSLGFC